MQAATYSYIGEFHSNATRTRAAAFVAMFMPACFVYLPLLAWLIIPMQWEWYLLDFKIAPWRLYLFCSSLLNCFNFICLYYLPESPKFLLSIGKKAETLTVLRRMYEINTGNAQEVRIFESSIWLTDDYSQSFCSFFQRLSPWRMSSPSQLELICLTFEESVVCWNYCGIRRGHCLCHHILEIR